MLLFINNIYFIICLINIINATVVVNENDILTNLSESNSIVTLEINSVIDITKEIKINNSIQKLYINGNSLDLAKLNLRYPLYFESNIEEIKIKNITINGSLFFKKNNKKITIDTVNLNGYIDSDFDYYSNNNIEIKKLNYKPKGYSVENCIYLGGNVKIDNSYFLGNSFCRNRLLHYNGFKKYKFDLKESKFNGEYECPFLSIENTTIANIESLYFEKGYSSRSIDGGVVLITTSSNVKVNNCTFYDILSYNDGGAFNFKNNIQIEGSNLNFYNVTSLGLGSIFQISSDDSSLLNFSNITQQNTGNVKNMREGGLVMNIEGQAKVIINSYHAENLINNEASGSAFIVSEKVKLTMKDVYIKNLIGNGEDGLFYTSHDSLDIKFNSFNVTLHNLYQLNKYDSSIINIDKNNNVTMEGLKLFNSGGYNTNFINIIDNSYVNFVDFEVDYFESKTAKEFVNYESDLLLLHENDEVNTFRNFKVSNIISRGVMFRIKNGLFYNYNCEFRNIHECYQYNNCTSISSDRQYVEDAELFIGFGGKTSGINFWDLIIDQMYGDVGLLIYISRVGILTGSKITNSYFKNGFFHFNEKKFQGGYFVVTNSRFENNKSESGTIFYLPDLDPGNIKSIDVSYSTFINNTATKFGGVIYAVGEYSVDRMDFKECTYINNHAEFGNIIYAHSKDVLPVIGPLKSSDISTIPAYFEINEDKIVSILSGEKIPEDIMFKLYDDYKNQMYFPHKTSNFQFDDLVFFNVEVNDTYNAKVLGQTKEYCWDEFCIFPPVKVIGNPGTYTLSLKFKSYGIYPKFVKDSVDIEIEIRKCNEKTHINQVIGNTYLKSCYIPKCEFNCNYKGTCVNNDLCVCSEKNFKGKFCNEHVKLERYLALDIFFTIMSSIIIIVIIVLIGMTIHFRRNSIIKGGGYEFLVIILIGLIINTVNAIFLTFEKTNYLCYQLFILSNTGFSFVFGSIFVKTYRIYKIFCQKKRFKIGVKKRTMYIIIIFMTLFHWLMAFWWYIFKQINIVNDYTVDNKEFLKCEYSKFKNLSSLFNFVILALEFILSYYIRKVEKKYKESLVIPAYAYIIYTFLMYIMENQKEINVVIQDYFDIGGTITITLVIIYDLFIVKFIEIMTEQKRISSLSQRKIPKSTQKNII